MFACWKAYGSLNFSEMFWAKFHGLRIAGLCLCAASRLCAENFAPPTEGPVAFRRDRLPLDADAMSRLSRQLVGLAQGLAADTAVHRRTAAQMLALATALDPGNAKARELVAELQMGTHRAVADDESLEKSRADVWQFLAWLKTPEAGAQGQALAACLTDVILVSDPKNPRAEALGAVGPQGAWTGWIPELSAYEARKIVQTPPPGDAAVKPGILLAKAQVFTPLWKQPKKTTNMSWILAPAPLQMSATTVTTDGETPFSLVVGTPSVSETHPELNPLLLQILEKHHGKLPADATVTIGSEAFATSVLSKKPQSITAAAAVLASSAISGREPDATIIGLLDETGAFTLPRDFWNQLQSLGTGTGGRLILPSAAAEFLPSMLALEQPRIFFEYEVMLASNFNELLDRTAKTPDGSLAKIAGQFREIREKGASQPMGQFMSNPFIRRRLAEMAQEAPYHYSAKMLAVQGAGNRPAFIPRTILTAELRRAIEPLEWLVKRPVAVFVDAEIDLLGSTYATCHGRIEQLLRYAEKSDRELAAKVQDMVTTVRTLERAAKSRGFRYEVLEAVTAANAAFMRSYAQISEELGIETTAVKAIPEP